MAKARILVVEDESIIAADIAMRLRNLGYEITATVVSGEQAIRKVGEDKPDLVLMDIVLKGVMDGIEAAEQIRSRFMVPVVFLTAHADKELLERVMKTDSFGYITKPFEEKMVRLAVEMALDSVKME